MSRSFHLHDTAGTTRHSHQHGSKWRVRFSRAGLIGLQDAPNGQAVTGFSHEYKRHRTTTLFAALNVLTGQVTGGHAHRRRRRDFLSFMNEVVAL